MIIEFEIPLAVKPKNSRKAFIHAGRAMLRDDPKEKANANNLIALCMPYRPPQPIEGPVMVTYAFRAAWRKSDAKKRAKGKLPDCVPRPVAPDLGNLCKNMDDVLQQCGFVRNDSQIVCYGMTRKIWADTAGVNVRIEPYA